MASQPHNLVLATEAWWSRHRDKPIGWLALTLTLGVAYFLTARLGLELMAKPENVAVFWPAAGFAAGAIVALGRGARTPVAIAVATTTLLANLHERGASSDNILAAIVFAACNMVECLVFAGIVTRFDPREPRLTDLRSLFTLLAATVLSTAATAVPAAIVLRLTGLSSAPLPNLWSTWMLSDALGIITVAPVLMTAQSVLREPPSRAMLLESGVALALTALAAGLSFSMRPGSAAWPIVTPVTVMFPLFMWLAGRMPPAFSALAGLMIPFVVILTAISGVERFVPGVLPLTDRVGAAQIAILSSSLCALTLAAMFARLRRVGEELRESQDHIGRALQAGRVYTFTFDATTGNVHRSRNAAEVLGVPPGLAQMTRAELTQLVHPDERAAFEREPGKVSPDNPVSSSTVRFVRPDGQIVWIESIERGNFDPNGRLLSISGVARDITERMRSQLRQSELVEELNHRVKNTLAAIAAVVQLSRRGQSSLDAYVDRLASRIASMARTHERLSESKWAGAELRSLLTDEVEPYRSDGNIALDGPDVQLGPVLAQGLASTLHELTTNAAKYGGLSSNDGRLTVRWRIWQDMQGTRTLTLEWRERAPQPIEPPQKTGFGVNTIRNQLRHERDAVVDLRFRSTGLECDITLPLEGLRRP